MNRTESALEKGEVYGLAVGTEEIILSLYEGEEESRRFYPFTHRLLVPCTTFLGGVFVYRVREDGFNLRGEDSDKLMYTDVSGADRMTGGVIIPERDSTGKFFHSDHYVPELDGDISQLSTEERERLHGLLQKAGLVGKIS